MNDVEKRIAGLRHEGVDLRSMAGSHTWSAVCRTHGWGTQDQRGEPRLYRFEAVEQAEEHVREEHRP